MPSLVEISSLVLEKKIFLNFVNVFSPFRNYLPLEKGMALHLNNLEFPIPKDALCQLSLVEICPVVLKKKRVKGYRRTDRRTSLELIRNHTL